MKHKIPTPACCIFDNPSTWAREAWVDGKLDSHIQPSLFESKGFKGFPELPFYLSSKREFEPGKLIGKLQALPTEYHHMIIESSK